MRLKLFYWDDVDVLEDFAPGQAFALAESKGQAIELIIENDGSIGTPRAQVFRLELNAKEPRTITEPEGFAIRGGS